MPILLTDDIHDVVLRDKISNTDMPLRYFTPTPEQVASFDNGHVKREGDEQVITTGENRIEHGYKVIAGFEKGLFQKRVGDKIVSISSDPDDPDHDEKWKKLIRDKAPHVLRHLAMHVFEGNGNVVKSISSEDDDAKPGDAKSNDKGKAEAGQEEKSLD